MQTATQPTLTLDRLYEDIEQFAALIETPTDPNAYRPVIDTYAEQFRGGVASFRVNTKRDMNVRYISPQPHDPLQIAFDNGLLTETGGPHEALQREATANLSLFGYGVDTNVQRGLLKMWTMFSEPVPVPDMLKLKSLPPAVHNYLDLFAERNYRRFSLMAIDFVNPSLNLYFLFRDPKNNPPDMAEFLISSLGFELPSAEQLALFSRAADIHFTFTWDNPQCVRLSFICHHVTPEEYPTHLHPIFERMIPNFPTLREQRYATLEASFTAKGSFLKSDMDYSGMALAFTGASDLAD